MSFFQNIFTGIAFFIGSLFGLVHPAPTATSVPVVVSTTTESSAPTVAPAPMPPTVNEESFSTSTERYAVQNNVVYFIFGSAKTKVAISGADSNSFSVICTSGSDGLSYAKDGSSVYLNDQKVVGANPGTFTLLSRFNDSGWYGCPEYSKDVNHVYQNGVAISDYPNSFTTFGANNVDYRQLLTDGHSVFYSSGVLSTDAPHFEFVNYPQAKFLYAKDSHTFYSSSPQSPEIDPIKNSDPASFNFIGDASTSLYARDKNLLYYFGGYGVVTQSITSVDLDFNTLAPSPNSNGGFSACSIKDKDHVYVQGYNLVPGADPTTFVVTDTTCQQGKDAKHQFNLNDYVPQGVG